MTDKVAISLTFKWEITKAEWEEGKEFWVETLKDKAEYDPKNMYWLLSNIKPPESKVEIIKL